MRHGVALVALIGWFAASGIGASPAAAQEEPIPDLAVTIIEAEVVPGADVVRLVAEYRNLGPVPLFGPPFLIVSADGAIVVDGLFGVGLEPGDSGREEWDVAIEDGWRGRAVGFEVVIAADNEEERGTIANNVASVAIDIPGGPIPPDGGGVPWVWPVVTIPPIVVVAGGPRHCESADAGSARPSPVTPSHRTIAGPARGTPIGNVSPTRLVASSRPWSCARGGGRKGRR